MDRGSYMNDDLAEYLVATSADVGSVIAFLLEDDVDLNPLGIKLGQLGVKMAIANAV